MNNLYTNSVGGWLLQALFYETTMTHNRQHALYTLKDTDHLTYASLYRLYMECNDPTEYLFATTHLGGWAHWERLCECDFFKPYAERWRKELELRFRANALRNVYDLANSPSARDKLSANKILLDGKWGKTEGRARGRPSKEEIKSEANRLAEQERSLSTDFERITGGMN
jgi:hypothetical protein